MSDFRITPVEVLVVLICLGLISVLVLPALLISREESRSITCQSHQAQLVLEIRKPNDPAAEADTVACQEDPGAYTAMSVQESFPNMDAFEVHEVSDDENEVSDVEWTGFLCRCLECRKGPELPSMVAPPILKSASRQPTAAKSAKQK